MRRIWPNVWAKHEQQATRGRGHLISTTVLTPPLLELVFTVVMMVGRKQHAARIVYSTSAAQEIVGWS